MKNKTVKILLLGFIILMFGGLLMSVKNTPNNDITTIVSNFENEDSYDTSGYVSLDPFDEDNVNNFGKLNGQIGDLASKGVNKGLDLIFNFLKKIIS